MDQQNKNEMIEIDVDIGLTHLEWQANNLIREIYFEEKKKNPNINTLNWLVKRILRSWSTVYVLKNKKEYQNKEQLVLAIDEKYVEYLYTFGRHLPKAVVKIEKLNYTAATTTTTTTTTNNY